MRNSFRFFSINLFYFIRKSCNTCPLRIKTLSAKISTMLSSFTLRSDLYPEAWWIAAARVVAAAQQEAVNIAGARSPDMYDPFSSKKGRKARKAWHGTCNVYCSMEQWPHGSWHSVFFLGFIGRSKPAFKAPPPTVSITFHVRMSPCRIVLTPSSNPNVTSEPDYLRMRSAKSQGVPVCFLCVFPHLDNLCRLHSNTIFIFLYNFLFFGFLLHSVELLSHMLFKLSASFVCSSPQECVQIK